MKIAVVDDTLANLLIVRKHVELLGHTAVTARDGSEALDVFEREKPDLILMDVQMPEMDGYEATRRIRETPALASQRIIAMTANAMAEDRRRCIDAGMDDFETKPIDPDHLFVTMAKWLSVR
mgnify:CR=1 FL=1